MYRSLVSACTCQSSMLGQPEIQTHRKTTCEIAKENAVFSELNYNPGINYFENQFKEVNAFKNVQQDRNPAKRDQIFHPNYLIQNMLNDNSIQ